MAEPSDQHLSAAMVNSRTKGIKGELDVVKYLRSFPEWPTARRSVAAGWSNGTTEHQDEGDLVGTPGLCFQVKNLARPLTGKLLTETWRETVAQAMSGNRHPIIIEKRAGCADVGRWWTHLSSRFYVELLTGSRQLVLTDHLVRVELGDIIGDLRMWSRERVDTH